MRLFLQSGKQTCRAMESKSSTVINLHELEHADSYGVAIGEMQPAEFIAHFSGCLVY